MRSMKCPLLLTLLAILVASAASAQVGPGPFVAFPTGDETDARFLGFSCQSFASLAAEVQLTIAVPIAETQFSLQIFDGETNRAGEPTPHWDVGTKQLSYRLYADPFRQDTKTAAGLVGEWFGNEANALADPMGKWTTTQALMPDNDWWVVTIRNDAVALAPTGDYYYYNLVIGHDTECAASEQLESNIKIAADVPLAFSAPRFALVAALRQIANDAPIVYEGNFPPPAGETILTVPTTYDGTFEFGLNVPPASTEIELFDADADFGTDPAFPTTSPLGLPSLTCFDDDDPQVPDDYSGMPAGLAIGADTQLEGAQVKGIPADDSRGDLFRRGEPGDPSRFGCVRIEITDPNGTVYNNLNPSSQAEWENFRIVSLGSSHAADPNDYDVLVNQPTLPAGIWRVRIVGLDMSNLVLIYAANGVCGSFETGLTTGPGAVVDPICPPPTYLLGDTVWLDGNSNGIQDSGEAGIPGVLMTVHTDPNQPALASFVTGDSSETDFSSCQANNTGLDQDGLYCFDLPEGSYTVVVDPSNFGPGGALEGLTSTTGGERLSNGLFGQNVLTYDFGYNSQPVGLGSLGDRVWWDTNGDSVQDVGEPGISEVAVTLLDASGRVVGTTSTDADGIYRFVDLPLGQYTVLVDPETLPVCCLCGGGASADGDSDSGDSDSEADSDSGDSSTSSKTTSSAKKSKGKKAPKVSDESDSDSRSDSDSEGDSDSGSTASAGQLKLCRACAGAAIDDSDSDSGDSDSGDSDSGDSDSGDSDSDSDSDGSGASLCATTDCARADSADSDGGDSDSGADSDSSDSDSGDSDSEADSDGTSSGAGGCRATGSGGILIPTYDLDGIDTPDEANAELSPATPDRTDVDFGYQCSSTVADDSGEGAGDSDEDSDSDSGDSDSADSES